LRRDALQAGEEVREHPRGVLYVRVASGVGLEVDGDDRLLVAEVVEGAA
jgi:hypothetical protein